jgi:pimeloyl-ACP methyl ester carboxylesterase
MTVSTCLGRARLAVLGLLACAAAFAFAPTASAASGAPSSTTPAAVHRTFREMQVDVVGSGRPVLMIPGLNSPSAVWADTCAALQPIECHLVQLPGFAGVPAAATVRADFLQDMRDRLLAYIDANKLGPVAVVGHSLGGELALMMAMKSPASVDRLVIVDSLPFLGALRDPAATPASMEAMAAGMRTRMLAATPAQTASGVRQFARGMARNPADVERLVDWGVASDRATTAQAWYELWTTDLRPGLAAIRCPVLVLGSWAAYAPMGATLESTRAIFEKQYATLPDVKIHMSANGFHFLMWDDRDWLAAEVRGALQAGT